MGGARWLLATKVLGVVLVVSGPAVGRTASRGGPPPRPGCVVPTGLPEGWGHDAHAGMVRVPGGAFVPGTTRGYADERPRARVAVAPFWMDRTEVTNAQFAAFVEATGYVTEAERAGGSAVFRRPPGGPRLAYDWWTLVRGASWRHPEGPGTGLRGRQAHPVVHVTVADAQEYARWLGRALPTEAQWESAARGAVDGEPVDVAPRDGAGRPLANFWQGEFPAHDTVEDGHAGPAPVACYPPDRLGLFDMIGNVWEWTRDPYLAAGDDAGACHTPRAPTGDAPPRRLVIKGGSFLCSPDFCARYRAAARQPQEAHVSTAHIGFRTVAATGE